MDTTLNQVTSIVQWPSVLDLFLGIQCDGNRRMELSLPVLPPKKNLRFYIKYLTVRKDRLIIFT